MIEFNTIHWLPKHLARMEEWQEICKAYDYLLSKAWAAMEVFYANQSLETLTVAGCEIWEKLLGITPKETDTLEERRFRILSWWSQELPYTLPKLNERLTALCGKDGYEIFEDFANYLMTFEIKPENRENINSIVDMLDRMRPANMVVHIKIIYKKTDRTYVGMAYKSTKVVTPTDKEAVDPMGDVTLFTYGDDLLTDSYRNPLKDAKET